MIQARQLTFRVEQRDLVHSVDLELRSGEVVVALGPNGAGKSTLLKLLCGQLRPTSGQVVFKGRPIEDWSLHTLACSRAVLPQQTSTPFDFTALEIVLLGRSPHGDAARSLLLAHQAMDWTECRHLADRSVSTLSGGELQRVNLARVLVQIGLNSDLRGTALFLDEPTASFDPSHQHAALRIARCLAERGAAVFIVLHDLNLAAQYADRLALMKEGHLVAAGAPHEVLRPALLGPVFDVTVRLATNPFGSFPAVFVEPLRNQPATFPLKENAQGHTP